MVTRRKYMPKDADLVEMMDCSSALSIFFKMLDYQCDQQLKFDSLKRIKYHMIGG